MRRTIAGSWPLFLAGCLACCSSSSGGRVASTAQGGAGGDGGDNSNGADAGDAADAGSAGALSDAGAGAGQTNEGGTDNAAGAAGAAGEGGQGDGVRQLFNGVDFTNWDRYLGKPSPADPALGLNNDPHGVYSVVMADGEPAIRISGQDWGSLISKEEFCNFDLRLQYKWGALLWPPLNAQDSGVMFLSSGPLGAVNAGGSALSDPIGSGGFMVSVEYQIAAGDVGSLYNLGPIAFSTSHMSRPELAGVWNQVEIIHQGDVAVSLLNGEQVTRAADFRLDWPGQPESLLACGQLQLQSEGAEIFFRHVEIQALP
jgi:Domain of Unknown Function (DUF1080)